MTSTWAHTYMNQMQSALHTTYKSMIETMIETGRTMCEKFRS